MYYTFLNSLFLQVEALYNNIKSTNPDDSFIQLQSGNNDIDIEIVQKTCATEVYTNVFIREFQSGSSVRSWVRRGCFLR
jgi:hypothetical protein